MKLGNYMKKINGIFEYEKFKEDLAEMLNIAMYSDEYLAFQEKCDSSLYVTENYKEINKINIPVDKYFLKEDSSHNVFIAETINKFADTYNLKSVMLTNSIEELCEL